MRPCHTGRGLCRAGLFSGTAVAALHSATRTAFAQTSPAVALRFGVAPSAGRGPDDRSALYYELHVRSQREANGVVREFRDGVVDTPPLYYEPPPARSPDLADAGGNYVVLDIGAGRFVHYAHLQQGSVRVRVGQRVRRGDLIGKVGNSGNTNGPHLHFNVVDHPRQTLAEGLPYVFESIISRDSTTVGEAFGDSAPAPPERRSARNVLSLNGAKLECSRL